MQLAACRTHDAVAVLFAEFDGGNRPLEAICDSEASLGACADAVLRREITARGGQVFKTLRDGCFASFKEVNDAMAAASAAQRALVAGRTAQEATRVRMAIDVGPVVRAGQSYVGPAVNRVARLVAAAHGGQILLSAAAAAKAINGASKGRSSLRDLGWHGVRHLAAPERVYQLVAPELPASFPPLHAPESVPNNLPIPSTSFVGRDAEIETLRNKINESRLTTLVGAGGVGKTRLALQAGFEAIDSYPDGVWFVDLADRKKDDDVAFAVASVWQHPESTGHVTADTVVEAFRHAHLLLIVDNCEHLVDAAARFAGALLNRCAAVRILATSREPLGIDGEQIHRVTSLPTPEHVDGVGVDEALSFPAVELFFDRARAANANFSIENNVSAVARIVQRLDGIPLAIELAARRLRTFSVEELDAMLAQRWQILGQSGKSAVPRHRTMRAAIDWSYELLDSDEKRLFARLAVFAGSCTLDAARAVAADDVMGEGRVLELLESLADKSLFDTVPQGSQQRYRFLEPTRQFALEKLRESGEENRLRGAHARYFAHLAASVEPSLETMTESGWSARYGPEVHNLRGALDWSTSNDPVLASKIVAGLALFWEYLSLAGEGLVRSEAVLEALAGRAQEPEAVRVWLAVSNLALQSRMARRTIEAAEIAIALAQAAQDEIARVKAVAIRAVAQLWAGDLARSPRVFEEALNVFREHRLALWMSRCLYGLANSAIMSADYGAALSAYDAILASPRAAHWPSLHYRVELNQAECKFARGDVEAAIEQTRNIVERSRETGARMPHGVWCNLASYCTISGDLTAAVAYARRGLEVPRWAQDPALAPFTLQTVALIATKSNRPSVGAQLLGYVNAVLDREGISRDISERAVQERLNAALAQRLSENEIATGKVEGAMLGDDAARELGLRVLNDGVAAAPAARTSLELLQERVAVTGVAARLTVQELALLTLLGAAKRALTLSEICDALWPAADVEAARSALHCCLYRLRKRTLQNIVVQSGDSYAIGDDIDVDLRRLRASAASIRGKRELDDADLDELARIGRVIGNRKVVRLMRYDWFADVEAKLIDLYGETAERLLSELSRRRLFADVARCAETMLADDPCDEVATEYSIRARIALDDGRAAVQIYDRYRNALKRELDEKPSLQIRSLMAAYAK